MRKSLDMPEKQTRILFAGPVGNIELLISPTTPGDIIAIICHPHPLFQGTMDNKVVYTAHKALTGLGYTTIRFNFRGVGLTQGKHNHGIGETDDLLAIIGWIKNQRANAKIILAGFSFGAYIALKASKKTECACLISIAPAVHHQDYKLYLPLDIPWLVIQGTADEIVPANLVFELIENFSNPSLTTLIKFPDTGHFFHGNLPQLKDAITSYFLKILNK